MNLYMFFYLLIKIISSKFKCLIRYKKSMDISGHLGLPSKKKLCVRVCLYVRIQIFLDNFVNTDQPI